MAMYSKKTIEWDDIHNYTLELSMNDNRDNIFPCGIYEEKKKMQLSNVGM